MNWKPLKGIGECDGGGVQVGVVGGVLGRCAFAASRKSSVWILVGLREDVHSRI